MAYSKRQFHPESVISVKMVQQTAKEAYVTLVTSDNYGVGALVLAHSLRDAGSVRRLVCLVTAAVSPLMQGRLRGTVTIKVLSLYNMCRCV